MEKLVLYVTGNDGLSKNAFNVSTLSSIIAASLGVKVIKHVSYDTNKRCSDAMFLEEMGIRVCKNIKEIEDDFFNKGIAFVESLPSSVTEHFCPLVAPIYETARFVGTSQFNVAMAYLFEFRKQKYPKAMVAVSSDADYDEAGICSSTHIFELNNEKIFNYTISPENYGMAIADKIALTGATPLYNKNLAIDIFSKKIKGPKMDVLSINSALMLHSAGFTDNIKKGIIMSYESLETLNALNTLEILRG